MTARDAQGESAKGGGLTGTWRTVLRLAFADLWAEWVLALCTVLALSAVMAPLLVLAGLRAGVVQGLRETLLDNPHAREIVSVANRRFDTDLLASVRQRPDVAFLVPKTRTLAASLLLEVPDQPGSGIRVELLPTQPGDPLLGERAGALGNGQIVLSASAAARLHAAPRQVFVGKLGRVLDGQRQTVALPLEVAAIAPAFAFERDGAFVTLELAVFIEDYQGGSVGPVDDPARIAVAPRKEFPGFRLYARRLEDVPVLDGYLRGLGIDVVSRAGDVEGLLKIDRGLGLLLGLVAGLGGAGFMVSLGAGLWANVERKRVPLALLRFLGLSAAALSLFPAAQACALAVLGAGAATAGALGVAAVINSMFADALAVGRPLCSVSVEIVGTGFLIAVGGAALVAVAAGRRASKVEPWEGVTPP
jgi:putative ABC transport system permease protein